MTTSTLFPDIQPRSGDITIRPEPGTFALRCREYQTPHDYVSVGEAQRAIRKIEAQAASGDRMSCHEQMHQVLDFEFEVVIDSFS